MDRRRIVRACLSGCLGLLAGCASPSPFGRDASESHKPRLEAFVVNDTSEVVTVTVSAVRGSSEFFEHTYTLRPGHADESESFVGTPTEIRVSIRNGRDVRREYSIPAWCESPELNVRIRPEAIAVNDGCVRT